MIKIKWTCKRCENEIDVEEYIEERIFTECLYFRVCAFCYKVLLHTIDNSTDTLLPIFIFPVFRTDLRRRIILKKFDADQVIHLGPSYHRSPEDWIINENRNYVRLSRLFFILKWGSGEVGAKKFANEFSAHFDTFVSEMERN